MLNEKEMERFELIEKELQKLRSEIKIQNLVISGLLNGFFNDGSKDHSHFYSAIREEIEKLPHGSDIRHDCANGVTKWADKYNN